MKAATLWSMVLSVFVLSLVHADDEKDKAKNDKKSKLPPLTVIGYYDGEIVYANTHSDQITIRYKEIVQKWVQNGQGGPNNPVGRRLNFGQGGGYVAQEESKDTVINLAPDVKVRLMYTKQASFTAGNKKEKAPPAKDTKETKEATEKDADAKLGGKPGKKSQLSKGQIVRVTMGRNNDPINPQNYGMVVYVVTEGAPASK